MVVLGIVGVMVILVIFAIVELWADRCSEYMKDGYMEQERWKRF